MKQKTRDPDGYSPNDIIERLHRCIDSGVYGQDQIISARDKNEEFYQNYLITERERIEVLRNLSISDHDGWDFSDDPFHPEDIVHFFHYSMQLFPRGIEEAPLQRVNLYIKLTWTKTGNILIVISFHN